MSNTKIRLILDMRDPEEGLPNYMRECDPPRPTYDLEELADEIETKTLEKLTPGVYALADAISFIKEAKKDEELSGYAVVKADEAIEDLQNSLEDTVEAFLYDVLDEGPGRDYLYHFSVEVSRA